MNSRAGNVTSFQELLRLAVDFETSELHVCMPGKVESYDSSTGLASVKPTLSRRMRGAEEAVEYPVIPRVPVVQPRTQAAQIHMPISKGDLVLLVFADRNIENWLDSDGSEAREVNDVRRHALSDAYAIPGGFPSRKPPNVTFPEALTLQVGQGTPIYIGNDLQHPVYGNVELSNLIYQIIFLLGQTKGNLGGPLSTIGDWQQLAKLMEETGLVAGL